MNAKNVLTFAADQEARFVSVRFTDLIGSWHHLTFPIDQLTDGSFEDGFGFDASSLRGWAAIHESDMLLVPDPSRFWIDPFTEDTTVCLIANAVDPMQSKATIGDSVEAAPVEAPVDGRLDPPVERRDEHEDPLDHDVHQRGGGPCASRPPSRAAA